MVRDDWIQIVSTGVAAGVVSVSTVALFNYGFKSEDVFAFAGALLGASATVAGGAWIADRTTTRERRREQQLIVPELHDLHEVSNSASNALPSGVWSDEWRSSLHALADLSRGCDKFLEQVERFGKTLDFRQRETISDTRAAIRVFHDFYSDVFESPTELHPDDERTWPSVVNPIVQSSREAIAAFR